MIILLLLMTFRGGLEASQTWSQKEYEDALTNGEVGRVDITPNQEVPTGTLRVVLTDGDVKYVNVADVERRTGPAHGIFGYRDEYGERIRRDSVFLTVFLPTLVVGAVVVIVFMMMNRQAGGGNAKMMNFGKSRARDDYARCQAGYL